ncbi:MAG TPA: TetR/AcrR family transcriptional regulator [Kribbella sp.]|nr:TetR/AcrR family transcriptional regulator [Kribbella sp.]
MNGSDSPRRADARRNREKLLAVALRALSQSDEDVPLDAIAKAAGVGIGTLYRHFPTREALVEAVYRNEVERLCGAVDNLLRDLPPDQALREWMKRFVDYVATKRGMSAALQSVVQADSGLFSETRGRMTDALKKLLDSGIGAGLIRPDVDPDDLLRAMRGAWLAADEQADHAGRLLDLLMDGLRYGAPGKA